MCLCGGIGEVAIVATGVYVVKKKLKIKLPPLVEVIAGMRAGVRPGQVFKDKRRSAKVNARVEVKKHVHQERSGSDESDS